LNASGSKRKYSTPRSGRRMISASMLYLAIVPGVAMRTNMRGRAFGAIPKVRASSPIRPNPPHGTSRTGNPARCHLYQLPRRIGLAHGPARVKWGTEWPNRCGGKARIGSKAAPRTTSDGHERVAALARSRAVTVRCLTASMKSAASAAITATYICKTCVCGRSRGGRRRVIGASAAKSVACS
jgi:hypothetical protein